MTVAVRFEHVGKTFRLSQTRSLKDRLLGVAGHRASPVTVRAVDDLHLDIEVGESVALLGHNGSGKSTTLKMLAGTITPSSGRVWARGRIAPLLELGAGFHPDLTGRENVFMNSAILGIPRREALRNLDAIVDFAGVEAFLDTPVKFYSSGMAVRLGFAIAVNVDPDILLVDEVLAVGDEEFQARCTARMERLRDEGKTVVLVTHSLHQAKEFCRSAVVMHHGRTTYVGPMEGAEAAYHESSRTGPGGAAQ